MPQFGLSQRRLLPELMDDPGLDPALHAQALNGLARINLLSGAARPILREVAALAQAGRTPVRITDVACGSGDLLARVARGARRRGIPVTLTGCDLSPTALQRAQARFESSPALAGPGSAAPRWVQMDALQDPFPEGAELITCSLFLHHLERDSAVLLLRRMADATKARLLVQDLRRSRLGYLMAQVVPRFISRSPVVHIDAPLSVAGAFTLDEAATLAADAGLSGARIERLWPERWTLTWSQS